MQILLAEGIAPPGVKTAAKLKKLQSPPHGNLEKHLSEEEIAEYKHLAIANCREDTEALITDDHLDDYFANSSPSGKSGDTTGLRPDYLKAAYKDELVGRGVVREIIRLTAAGCFDFLVDQTTKQGSTSSSVLMAFIQLALKSNFHMWVLA